MRGVRAGQEGMFWLEWAAALDRDGRSLEEGAREGRIRSGGEFAWGGAFAREGVIGASRVIAGRKISTGRWHRWWKERSLGWRWAARYRCIINKKSRKIGKVKKSSKKLEKLRKVLKSQEKLKKFEKVEKDRKSSKKSRKVEKARISREGLENPRKVDKVRKSREKLKIFKKAEKYRGENWQHLPYFPPGRDSSPVGPSEMEGGQTWGNVWKVLEEHNWENQLLCVVELVVCCGIGWYDWHSFSSGKRWSFLCVSVGFSPTTWGFCGPPARGYVLAGV